MTDMFPSPRIYERNGASDNDSPQIRELSTINEDDKNLGSPKSHEPADFRELELQLTPPPSTLESSNGESLPANHLEQTNANQFTPPLLSTRSSSKSLMSNRISLKSSRSDNHSNNSKKSGGSVGSRGSIGTMKSFQSSRNPILELLKGEDKIGARPSDSEDDEPNRSKWLVLAFIGFIVVLTLICAVVEVKSSIYFIIVIFFLKKISSYIPEECCSDSSSLRRPCVCQRAQLSAFSSFSHPSSGNRAPTSPAPPAACRAPGASFASSSSPSSPSPSVPSSSCSTVRSPSLALVCNP